MGMFLRSPPMETLHLLLIEDTSADATDFVNQIQNKYPKGVSIVWRQTLDEAFRYLATHEVDQIWVDKELPDFNGADIAEALRKLKSFVDPSELYLLSASNSIVGTPKGSKVVAQPSTGEEKVLELVTQLLEKRSSSGTTKVQFAQIEGKIATLKYRLERAEDILRDIPQKLDELAIEQRFIKDFLNTQIPAIERKLSGLEEKVREAKGSETSKIERWKIYGGIVVTVLTVTGGVLSIALPIVLPRMLEGEKQEIKQDIRDSLKKDGRSR